MADKKLNNGYGYGQIELNNCAFRRDGRIEAQCQIGWDPTDSSDIEYLENGMILAINHDTRTRTIGSKTETITRSVEYPSANTYMYGINYTTEHIYDERLAGGLRYFKLERNSFYPRLGYLAVGDKFTTNTVVFDDALTLAVGQVGFVCAADKGYIRIAATKGTDALANAPEFKVIAVYTMPDGAPGVKLQCVKA